MKSDNSISISFLGDISLNDDYIEIAKLNINPFINVKDILFKSDFVVGNLESLIVGDNGSNPNKNPRLLTNAHAFSLLDNLNLKCVTLAHNHIYDHFEDGYVETTNLLRQKKIHYLGAGLSEKQAAKPHTELINGIKFCFLNYCDKNTNPNLPEDSGIYLNYLNIENVLTDIKKYREDFDFIIILLHWGGLSDYSSFPFFNQPINARKIIDAGCDLIIGGHTHTLQPYEIYKGKYIFYSLGNFCFSDLYFEGKLIYQDGRKARETIIVQAVFNKDKTYKIDLVGVENNKLFLQESSVILKRLERRRKTFNLFRKIEILWKINYFLFKRLHKYKSYFFNDGITNNKSFSQQFIKIVNKTLKKK